MKKPTKNPQTNNNRRIKSGGGGGGVVMLYFSHCANPCSVRYNTWYISYCYSCSILQQHTNPTVTLVASYNCTLTQQLHLQHLATADRTKRYTYSILQLHIEPAVTLTAPYNGTLGLCSSQVLYVFQCYKWFWSCLPFWTSACLHSISYTALFFWHPHAGNPTIRTQDSWLPHLLLLWTPHLEFTPTRP